MGKIGRNGKIILIFLFLAGVINYLDRSALSVAAPFIQEDLKLTPGQMGIIFSSFSIGYAIFNFVGGVASDKFGAKITLFVAMIVWSLFSGAIVLVVGFVSLFIVRILFGMGEGPLSATINKMVNNWYPPSKRATAVGLANSGTPLGGAISGPIVGYIALHLGWRVSFVAIMVIGLIWAISWWFFAKEKPDYIEETKIDEKADIAPVTTFKLGYYLKNPTVLFTAFAFFAYNYILFFFLTWFPSYLVDARNLSIENMSLITVIPWVLGFLGLAMSGIVSDFVYKHTVQKGVLFSRKVVLVVCLFLSAVCIGISGIVTTTAGAVTLVALSVLFLYLTGAIYWAIVQDVVDSNNVGSVGGFMHLLANTAGIVGPTITGYIIQTTGTYTAAFLLAGGLAVIASIAVIFFVKPIVKPESV
ncbi:MFS transporter [Mammaliicoccus sciuri]|jgi:ACS family hexuronate transporter-like MFS transporter|uniref:MFS transporter n=3 Tax=Mammaliicoccus sciuri TaxID=1296 RepID=A0AAI8DKF6_MAMSC|nr:MFS transporter [Mammaliicoccus sciuri]OOV38742.1 MFS transporter [Staphylococcus sp. MB371]PCQ20097.1 MFS transporter [Klebsiella pneumoniae]ASE35120.1 MFS transporter [Mammaliicoccus sciuri]KTT87168.1 hexuronate transporter [Mammaliicoccus sciuri]KTT90676.1 hexuronate transporter [Mammaliicoccus sciuri]